MNNSQKTAAKNPIPGNKPFQKGQSGNPNGRPKGTLNRSTIFKKWGELEINSVNPITGKNEKLSIDDTLALNLIRAGQEGNVTAIKEYFDNRFGKIKDSLEVEQKNNSIEFTREERKAFLRKYLNEEMKPGQDDLTIDQKSEIVSRYNEKKQ